ncbi:MAG: hypothetical protein ACMZ7B_13515 [Balneola sp.]
MENKKLNTAKMTATFGVLALIAGIVLLFMGEKLMGISGSIVGAGLALKSFKTIKELSNENS